MSQKFYVNILKSGIYFTLLSVFLVFQSLLFPYISSKQIFFNIVIEILLVFWLALIMKYPEYRPFGNAQGRSKNSHITHGLAAFCLAIFTSSIFGVDFNLSFWGDVERLLGVFHVLHFFAFYLIIITVFREWRDWKILFIISVIFATFVSLKGLGGNAYSTLGNTAYVSGYLIFNLYFAGLLFFRENNVLRWLYLIPVPIMLFSFQAAHTRGAHVGLGFSVILFLFLYGLLCDSKKARRYTLIAGAILVLITGFLFVNKDKQWMTANPVLRIVSSISFKQNTFQTRLIAWRGAAKDFKNHPFLGTGFGNFAIIFDKHFKADFFSYTDSETYFDRAHNNIVDIAATSGAIGLLAYLSIFVAAAYYLIQGYRQKKINLIEFCLLTCLITAYFIQNLAVFDSLVTYMGIMMTLGYIYWLCENGEEGVLERIGEKTGKIKNHFTKDRKVDNFEAYTLVIAGLFFSVVLYQCNLKPLQMLMGTIEAHALLMNGQVERSFEVYKEALSHNTVLDRDSRSMFTRLFSFNTQALQSLSQEKAQEILDYSIELSEKNVVYNPGDSMNQLFLSQALVSAAEFNKNNQEKFLSYSDRALAAARKAIEASPERMPSYYHEAQVYIMRDEKDKALEDLRYAVNLNKDFTESHCTLAKTLIFYSEFDEGYEKMDACLDKGGARFIDGSVGRAIANHYAQKGDWERLEIIIIRLTQVEPNNLENWINLIKLYAQTGDKEKARVTGDKIIELDHSTKADVTKFLESMP